jgi:hypothetical protein
MDPHQQSSSSPLSTIIIIIHNQCSSWLLIILFNHHHPSSSVLIIMILRPHPSLSTSSPDIITFIIRNQLYSTAVYSHPLYWGRIRERTISLSFLGLILEFSDLGVCIQCLHCKPVSNHPLLEVTVNSKEETSEDFCPNDVQEFGLCSILGGRGWDYARKKSV